MEKKLAEFRRAKQREKNQQNEITTTATLHEETYKKNEDDVDAKDLIKKGYHPDNLPILSKLLSNLTIQNGLKFLLWFCLFMFFLTIEFGLVYFTVSGLFLVIYSMSSQKKKNGELSAYSVFNENCERINGTFTAEQFERQMIYGRQPIVS